MQPNKSTQWQPTDFPCLEVDDIEVTGDSRCWYMNTIRLSASSFERFAREHLPWEEFESGQRKATEAEKIQLWSSRLTLRHALSAYTNQLRAPAEWKISTLPTGQRVLADTDLHDPDLNFSISHTRGIVLCAITTGKSIGIDVELAGRKLNPAVLNSHTYSNKELSVLQRANPIKRRNLALKLWTLKEATSKTLGKGMAEDFSGINFDISTAGEFSFNSVGTKADVDHWQLRHNLFRSRYYLAIVTA